MSFRIKLFLIFSLFLVHSQAQTYSYDVVVYGGTASGVIAGFSAAKEGLKVAILEPSKHIGGMVSGGLSITDIGNPGVIGGYAKKFWELGGAYYNKTVVYWYLEPYIAERVFNDLVNESGAVVFYNQRLKEQGGVEKQNGKITTLNMESGASFSAKV